MTFKHIVIIVQENRTPDNLFGSNPTFEPGVDIGTSGVNSKGQTIPLMPVALTACYDIDHRHGSFEVAFHSGFDKEIVGTYQGCTPPPNPQFKYVDNSSGAVQPYFDIATSYGFSNRMFETNQGPSFLAHQFLFGGTSAPSTNSSLFASENPLSGDQDTGCTAPTKQTVEVVDSYGSEHSHSPIYPCFEHPHADGRAGGREAGGKLAILCANARFHLDRTGRDPAHLPADAGEQRDDVYGSGLDQRQCCGEQFGTGADGHQKLQSSGRVMGHPHRRGVRSC